MFSKTYGYILKHPATRRGYWGNWYYKRRYERVLERLSGYCRSRKITILDSGCGLGLYAKYLEEGGSECRYVGCDVDDNTLKSACRGYDTDYVRCNIQQFPFRNRSAHVVLCSEVLEHLQFPYQTLEGISRVATQALIVTFPEESLLSAFRDSHPEHISKINIELVLNLLVSKGFNPVQVSHIFSSFIPCGVLEFLRVPRNKFTQTIVGSIDRLLEKTVPSAFVPHRTLLIEAKRSDEALIHP